MKSEDNSSNRQTWRNIANQFGLGALVGLMLAWIPLAISMPDWAAWNITASVALVLLCGTLSALFGKRFLAALMSLLESFPPIA
ncbi:MAG: hypothetical protein HC800_01275 [Phormidesmis sp. RL_2_1]|nr:hypothetical protein [Phormidesmis sp. RL_2_1]